MKDTLVIYYSFNGNSKKENLAKTKVSFFILFLRNLIKSIDQNVSIL